TEFRRALPQRIVVGRTVASNGFDIWEMASIPRLVGLAVRGRFRLVDEIFPDRSSQARFGNVPTQTKFHALCGIWFQRDWHEKAGGGGGIIGSRTALEARACFHVFPNHRNGIESIAAKPRMIHFHGRFVLNRRGEPPFFPWPLWRASSPEHKAAIRSRNSVA